jgi:hypothetical protein
LAIPNFNAMGSGVLDDLAGLVDDVLDRLAVRELAKVLGRATENVDSVDAGFDSGLNVVHVATDVSENLGSKIHAGDVVAVLEGLGRCCRGGELDVISTEIREHSSNITSIISSEVGTVELLSFAESRVNDLEVLSVVDR